MKKILILGAGGTGLATGFYLTEAGLKVEIYDKASVVGGLAASEYVDGMYYDYGPHIYHTDSPEIKEFWKKHFSDLLVEKEFYSQNYIKRVFYDYPLSYEGIDKFAPELREKIKSELRDRKPEKFKRAINFKECLVALLGPTLEEMFFDGYSTKLWGIPTDQMAASWAPKRVEIRKEHKSFWYNQYSAAPVYGSGKIMEWMAEKIQSRGSKVFLEHRATGTVTKNHEIIEIRFSNGKTIKTQDTVIISTIPINILSSLIGVTTDLEFASFKFVYLLFDSPEIFPPNVQTIYFSEPEYWFHRATEQRKYSSYEYPDNRTLLCFETSLKNKDFLRTMDEQQIVQKTLDQFCATGMIAKSRFVKGFVRTLDHVNPIMRLGYEEELVRVKAKIGVIRNLHCVGGNAEFKYGDLQVMFAKARDMADLLTSKHYVINKNIKAGKLHTFNEMVEVYGYKVGGGNPSLIVAELGLNHNGDVELGKELIKQAKACGADIVKLQTYSEESRVSATAKAARYADKTLQMEETSYEMFKRLRLTYEDHVELFQYAREIGIPIASTPFDEQSVDWLIELGVKAFKIASFDIVNIPLLRYIASKNLPIILSTGMSSLATIEDALDAIAAEENPSVILLHCVSSYPASVLDVNLRAMETMKQAFKIPVGYSDHTVGNLIADMSMTLGAHIIEKHFTLDHRLEGTDHILSMDPSGLRGLVADRETIFSALGSGIKRPAPSEYEQINLQRKSIFTARAIKKGETLSLDNLTIKGPGHGLLPRYFNVILGKKIARDLESDSPLTWDDLLLS